MIITPLIFMKNIRNVSTGARESMRMWVLSKLIMKILIARAFKRKNGKAFDKILSQQEVTDALCINSMAYNIERIGDNATNIAEAAIYLIEGKNIKHWPKPDEDLLLAGSEG